jgi:cellulose biosynthesis protein BcsE
MTTSQPTVRLGIPRLPSLTDGMVSGGLYIFVAESAATRFPLLSYNLKSALDQQIPCTVILPQNPEVFIQRIESFGNVSIAQACTHNQMRLFVTQEEFSKKLFRHGTSAFVEELDHYQVPEGGYLLFDQADDAISLHDVNQALEQVDSLRNWAQSKRVTLMLVLTRLTEANAGALNALMDETSGIVYLRANRSGLELSFDYWQSTESSVAARSFYLSTLDSGLYEVSSEVGMPNAGGPSAGSNVDLAEEPSPAEMPYFFMDADLGSLAKQTPGRWTYVESVVSLLHVTRNVKVATCILVFKRDTNLRQLAETVHTMRTTMGRQARIVVQEKEASLRYQNEALLLKLGVTLVIHRDVALSQYPLTLGSLRGQIFSREVETNFEAALASVLPSHLTGYLEPKRFVREATQVQQRAEPLDIPCALVIGEPAAPLTREALITQNGISRPGDLMTADNQCCYIFLNACPEASLLTALDRVLKRPLASALRNPRFAVSKAEIQSELSILLRATERENLPDFTELANNQSLLKAPPVNPVVQISPVNAQPAPTSRIPGKGQAVSPSPRQAQPAPTAPPTPAAVDRVQQPLALEPAPVLSTSPQGEPSLPVISESFQYDGVSNVRTFGRTLAPRAKRAVQK